MRMFAANIWWCNIKYNITCNWYHSESFNQFQSSSRFAELFRLLYLQEFEFDLNVSQKSDLRLMSDSINWNYKVTEINMLLFIYAWFPKWMRSNRLLFVCWKNDYFLKALYKKFNSIFVAALQAYFLNIWILL